MEEQFSSLGHIVISSISVYIFIVLALRLFGKKELAQLSVVDLVFILLISNSVQNAMVGPDTTLIGGLVAATSLFIVNNMFKVLIYRFPSLGKVIQGHAVLLVYKGVINRENMEKVKLPYEELMEAVREHGAAAIEDVDLAILEVDGNISILSNEFNVASSKKRKSDKVTKAAD